MSAENNAPSIGTYPHVLCNHFGAHGRPEGGVGGHVVARRVHRRLTRADLSAFLDLGTAEEREAHIKVVETKGYALVEDLCTRVLEVSERLEAARASPVEDADLAALEAELAEAVEAYEIALAPYKDKVARLKELQSEAKALEARMNAAKHNVAERDTDREFMDFESDDDDSEWDKANAELVEATNAFNRATTVAKTVENELREDKEEMKRHRKKQKMLEDTVKVTREEASKQSDDVETLESDLKSARMAKNVAVTTVARRIEMLRVLARHAFTKIDADAITNKAELHAALSATTATTTTATAAAETESACPTPTYPSPGPESHRPAAPARVSSERQQRHAAQKRPCKRKRTPEPSPVEPSPDDLLDRPLMTPAQAKQAKIDREIYDNLNMDYIKSRAWS